MDQEDRREDRYEQKFNRLFDEIDGLKDGIREMRADLKIHISMVRQHEDANRIVMKRVSDLEENKGVVDTRITHIETSQMVTRRVVGLFAAFFTAFVPLIAELWHQFRGGH